MSDNFQIPTKADDKARQWCAVAYPESLPIDYVSKLESLHLPFAISPLHYPDTDSSDESEFKPHYHIIFEYDSPAKAKKLYDALLYSGVIKGFAGYRDSEPNYNTLRRVGNRKTFIRYMCHLDQPTKQQLRWSDMRAFNGIDIDCALSPTYSQELDYSNEIIQFCEENNVFYFYDLVLYARENYFDTWFVFLKQNSYFIKEFLRSKGARRDYDLKKEQLQADKELLGLRTTGKS